MKGLFSPDGPVMEVLRKLMYCVLLNMIFLLCCLPVITIGAALTSLYYTIQKVLKNDRGYVFRAFFQSFKDNLKQTIPVGVVMVLVLVIFQCDSWILQEVAAGGHVWGNAYILFEILKYVVIVYSLWVFAYIARFENSTGKILKNASLLMIRHLPTSLLFLVIGAAGGFAMYLLPITMCICPVVMMWFLTALTEKVFFKYMSEADKAMEAKRNMIYQ